MQIEIVSPADLHIEESVRGETKIDSTFLGLIKNRGALVPGIAVKDEAGTVTVRDSQRRALASREAGLETIPAYISELQDEKTHESFNSLSSMNTAQSLNTAKEFEPINNLPLKD